MSNIFTYRPKLQYVYEEINTIYNVLSKEEQSYVDKYTGNANGSSIETYEETKREFYNILEDYKNIISNIKMKYPIGAIPSYIIDIVARNSNFLTDLHNNTISGAFIDTYMNNNMMSEVLYHWDETMKGLSGNGIVEMHKILKKVEYFVNLFDKCLDKTLYLWYNIYSSDNKVDEFKKNYLLRIENLVKLNNERKNALKSADDRIYSESTKNIHKEERFLDCTNNYLYVVDQVSSLMNSVTRMTDDMINPEKIYEHSISVENRVQELIKNPELDDKSIKSLLYNSYKKNYKELETIEAKESSSLSHNNTRSVVDNFGRYNKYYAEVLSSSLATLRNDVQNNKYGYVNCLFDGLDNINNEYEKNSLIMCGYINNLKGYAMNSSRTVYRKNDMRSIYNSFCSKKT